MLKYENIEIKITNRIKNYYSTKHNKQYTVGDIITIKIIDLSKSSHIKVDAICDICGEEHKIFYYNYITQINGYNFYSCKKCSNEKNKETIKLKYGLYKFKKITTDEKIILIKNKCNSNNYIFISFISNLITLKCNVDNHIWTTTYRNFMKYDQKCDKCSENIRLTTIINKINTKCLKMNYMFLGFENEKYINNLTLLKLKCSKHTWTQSYKHFICCDCGCPECGIITRCLSSKITRIKNGNQLSDDKISKYDLYRRKVHNKTRLLKQQLFENWNGYDFYDNEYIKDNLTLKCHDKNYPTIDHKLSVCHCFENDISIEICANIDNLCITKRRINSTKGRKIDYN